jgi:hypothetical protein
MVVGEVGVAIVRYFMCYVVAFENPLRPEIRNYFAGELMEQGLLQPRISLALSAHNLVARYV